MDKSVTSSKTPINTHLWFELDSSMLYILQYDAGNGETELYYSSDDGANWTQIDVDPSNTSSDNKSRDHYTRAAWHDRANEIIYFADAGSAAAHGDDFDVWKLDYSGSETAPSVTEIGSSTDQDAGTVDVYDIFIEGTDVFVLCTETQTIAGTSTCTIWEVDTAPFTRQDDIAMKGSDLFYYGVVVGTKYYNVWNDGLACHCFEYDDATTTITQQATFANHYLAYDNQKGMTYDDSNLIYVVLYDSPGNAQHICSYNISGDSWTEIADLDICVMTDRNTASGVLEKAFHRTSYAVYQLHSKIAYQWHLISIPGVDGAILGITDNYLIETGGEIWKYEDVSSYVITADIVRMDMTVPSASFQLLKPYTLGENMFIQIQDTFTTATSSSTAIIFEGYVDSFDEERSGLVMLISPANELLNIKPSGDYSGRTDQIISSLISAYCNYITAGTLSNGAAMGTITFYGDKTMERILDELAYVDNFIWYLTPEGELYYNSGAVDSGVDLDDDSHLSNVKKMEGMRAINYVDIRGGIVSGAQVSGTVQQNQGNQTIYGVNPYERTYAFLDTAALCTTANTNVLTRLGTQAKIVEFIHQDSTKGIIQEGQTITFERTLLGASISSAQYGIREVRYNAVFGKGTYRMSDRII